MMKNTDENKIDINSYLYQKRKYLGHCIRGIREKRGLSQEQLAAKMNISRSTISKIESGKFNCSIDYVAKFAMSLDFEIIIKDNTTI